MDRCKARLAELIERTKAAGPAKLLEGCIKLAIEELGERRSTLEYLELAQERYRQACAEMGIDLERR
jgi:hypothetical protein